MPPLLSICLFALDTHQPIGKDRCGDSLCAGCTLVTYLIDNLQCELNKLLKLLSSAHSGTYYCGCRLLVCSTSNNPMISKKTGWRVPASPVPFEWWANVTVNLSPDDEVIKEQMSSGSHFRLTYKFMAAFVCCFVLQKVYVIETWPRVFGCMQTLCLIKWTTHWIFNQSSPTHLWRREVRWWIGEADLFVR